MNTRITKQGNKELHGTLSVFRQKNIRPYFSLIVFLWLCLSFFSCDRRELTYYMESEIEIHADWNDSGLADEEADYGATAII